MQRYCSLFGTMFSNDRRSGHSEGKCDLICTLKNVLCFWNCSSAMCDFCKAERTHGRKTDFVLILTLSVRGSTLTFYPGM